MGLFGSDSRSTSNVSNYSNSVTRTRDIGFTGQQGVNVLNTLTRNVGDTLGDLGGTYSATLRSLGDTYGSSVLAGYQLAEYTQAQSYQTVRDIGAQSNVTLNNLIGAARDFAQRALSAGTGQATPLQQIGTQAVPSPTVIPVGNVDGGSNSKLNTILAIAGVGIALWSLSKSKK